MMARSVTIDFSELLHNVSQSVCVVRSHSGSVQPGDVFVVLPPSVGSGKTGTGGEVYIDAVLQAGAAYIVCPPDMAETMPERVLRLASAPVVHIVPHSNPRAALGALAAEQFHSASGVSTLIGITGTNGKTTESYILEALFAGAGHAVGLIGTIEYRWPGHAEASPLTTPGCLEMHNLLRHMDDARVDTVIMEVSSHALDQERIAGLNFSGALFTNLTQDHLDYHLGMEDYFEAKARLFQKTDHGGVPFTDKAVAVNADDPYGVRLLTLCPHALSYGFAEQRGRHLQGTLVEQSVNGLVLTMRYQGEEWTLRSPLVGAFNAANLLGAQAMGLAMGLSSADMAALETFTGAPGRLERIINPDNRAVFVDYAHTPDALIKAITALKNTGFGRVITVFGCGGNRDKGKRPIMGEAVAEYADVAVLTSDNPRNEDPLAIMADVLPGLNNAKQVIQEADRRQAIRLGLEAMRPGDALLVAGKGHENYQILGDTRLPFSDREVIKELLGCA